MIAKLLHGWLSNLQRKNQMSKVAELAYDIEQMYIEGYSPKTIAAMLECPVSMVYDWLEDNSIVDEQISEAEWDVAFPQQSVDAEDYYGA